MEKVNGHQKRYHRYSKPEKYILHHLFSLYLPPNPPLGSPNQSTTFGAISEIMGKLFQDTYDSDSILNQYYSWLKKEDDVLAEVMQQFSILTHSEKMPIDKFQINSYNASSNSYNEIQLRETITQLQKEKAVVDAKAIQFEWEKIELKRQLNNLESEIQKYKESSNSFVIKIGELENTISYLNDEVTKLHTENEAIKSQNDLDFSKLMTEFEQLKEFASKMQERISELEKENQQLNLKSIAELIEAKLKSSPESLFFLFHISQFVANSPGNKSNRWNASILEELIQQHFQMTCEEFSDYFYGLISFLPEYWFRILQKMFILPSLSTCRRKREAHFQRLSFSFLCMV